MGTERYGIFVVFSGIVGLANLLNSGTPYALMRSVPWHRARSDDRAAARAVSSAIVISLLTGTVLAAALLFLGGPLVSVLHISSPARSQARSAVVAFAALVPIVVLSSVMSGLGRSARLYSVTGALDAAQVIALNIAWVVISGRRHDLVELAWAQVIIAAVLVGIAASVIKRRRSWALRWIRPERASLREVAGFSARVSAGQLALGLLTTADKPILGAILPVRLVAIYSIPFAFAMRITMVPSSLSSALVPPAAAAFAKGDFAQVVRLRHRAFSAVGIVAGALSVGCVFAGPALFELWLGRNFAAAATPGLAALGIGFGVMSCGVIANALLDAAGVPGRAAAAMAVGSSIGLVLLIVLTLLLRTPVAASIGVAVGLTATGVVAIDQGRRIGEEVDRRQAFQDVFGGWLALALSAATVFLVCKWVDASAAASLVVVGSAIAIVAARLLFSRFRGGPLGHERAVEAF